MPKSEDSQEQEIVTLKQMIHEAEEALAKMHETVLSLESKTRDSKEKQRGA